jgi:prolyl 4-hydroxylase
MQLQQLGAWCAACLALPFLLLTTNAEVETASFEVSIDTVEPVAAKSSEISRSNDFHGVDESWPMHHMTFNSHRLSDYRRYMEGCYENSSKEQCMENEVERIQMNLRQPRHMQNFTSAGYAKVKAPSNVYSILRRLWQKHNFDDLKEEEWDAGNTYVNHWESKTKLLDIDEHLSDVDYDMVEREMQKLLEAWSHVPLEATSVYGIRAYTNGSILAPHADRLPLVISAIVNVDQDVEEDWPLEVIDHSGRSVNVTMQPGDMILYESHSVIHGRPYPLRGKYFANVFVHFEPLGYTSSLDTKIVSDIEGEEDAETLFEQAFWSGEEETDYKNKKSNKKGHKEDLPPYISPDSSVAPRWRQHYIFDRQKQVVTKKYVTTGVTDAHHFAANGELKALQALAKTNPDVLVAPDSNGWRAIHEAARGGRTEVIEYLIQMGVDLNERTNNGDGGSALWWAEHMLHHDHPAIRVMRDAGAVAIPPRG